MSFKIIVPSTAASLRTRLDVFVLQDVLDRLATDPRDAKATKFSEDLGIAESGLPSDLEHEVSEDLALASRLTHRGLAALRLPSPAIESARSHDRNQFLDGRAKRPAKLEEPVTFFTASVNLPRDTRPQDLVFFFEIPDLSAEMAVGGTGDKRQQRVKQLGHWTSLV